MCTFTSYTMTVMAQLSIAKEIFAAELADIANLLHMLVYQQHCTSILDHIIAFITLCTYVQQGYAFGYIGLWSKIDLFSALLFLLHV